MARPRLRRRNRKRMRERDRMRGRQPEFGIGIRRSAISYLLSEIRCQRSAVCSRLSEFGCRFMAAGNGSLCGCGDFPNEPIEMSSDRIGTLPCGIVRVEAQIENRL